MVIYLAGPMRGIVNYNFDTFDEVANALRAEGHTVFNPADIDRENGFDPHQLPRSHDWSKLPEGMEIRDIVRRDLKALLECDAIWLLPGWSFSRGAQAEFAVASWLGLEIMGAWRK